jgi:adenosylcobinamide-GDP ribazoletransferase
MQAEDGAELAGAEPQAPAPWPAPLRGARAAFLFFSRLPVGGYPYRAADWSWAPAHLPLVGAVVGAACAGVLAGARWLGLAPLAGAGLALLTSLWLTGALHEDGLADSLDGLGGARGDRQRALEIMKDSRIGTFGASALVCSLLLRAAAITQLEPAAGFALVYVHVWARVAPVWLLWREPYVNERGDAKSRELIAARGVHVATALAWAVACAALGSLLGWLPGPAALAAALATLLTAVLLGRTFRARLGGVTGDLLGCAEQVAEVAAWLTLCATLGR